MSYYGMTTISWELLCNKITFQQRVISMQYKYLLAMSYYGTTTISQ